MPDPSFPTALHEALLRNTGYLVSRSGVIAQRGFAQRIAALGLSPRMWGALNVLESEQPISQQGLGHAIGMDPSTMVATIDELERQRLVQRRPHPTDRRAHALRLTAQGKKTLGRGRELAREAQDDLLGSLTKTERAALHELLLKIVLRDAEAEDLATAQPPPGGSAGGRARKAGAPAAAPRP